MATLPVESCVHVGCGRALGAALVETHGGTFILCDEHERKLVAATRSRVPKRRKVRSFEDWIATPEELRAIEEKEAADQLEIERRRQAGLLP